MKVTLPYGHEVDAGTEREGPFRTYKVMGTAEFDIPELSSDEAPVAFEASPDSGACFAHRAHAGRVMVPLDPSRAPLTVEGFAAFLRDGSGPDRSTDGLAPWRVHLTDEYGALLPTVDELVGRTRRLRVTWDEGDEARAELQADLSRSLVVIDGHVWTSPSAIEPRIVVRLDEKDRVSVDICASPRNGGLSKLFPPQVTSFRLDRRDDAMAFAQEYAKAVGRPVRVSGDVVAVQRPDLLAFDDVVDLAETVLDPRRLRADVEASYGAVRFALGGLLALRRSDRVRDRAWAIEVMEGCGAVSDAVDAVEAKGQGWPEGAPSPMYGNAAHRWRVYDSRWVPPVAPDPVEPGSPSP